jgi:hypothetical protein
MKKSDHYLLARGSSNSAVCRGEFDSEEQLTGQPYQRKTPHKSSLLIINILISLSPQYAESPPCAGFNSTVS